MFIYYYKHDRVIEITYYAAELRRRMQRRVRRRDHVMPTRAAYIMLRTEGSGAHLRPGSHLQ